MTLDHFFVHSAEQKEIILTLMNMVGPLILDLLKNLLVNLVRNVMIELYMIQDGVGKKFSPFCYLLALVVK